MASATELETYENLGAKSEEYYCNPEENDQIYEAVEPVDGTEDTPANVETNKNVGQSKMHVQPQAVEQMELNVMSKHGMSARRTSVSLDTGIKFSRYDRWLRRLLAATCVLSALTIGCWITIGMLFLHSVDGGWSIWSHWADCSSSCGTGLSNRRRQCNNPTPSLTGTFCFGDPTEYALCEVRSCPVNGNWAAWSKWSSCSKSCGVGLTHRKRTCNNPEPSAGGKYCDGVQQEFDSCETRICAGWMRGNVTRASFSARLGQTKKYTGGETIVFRTILNNDGDAYDANTGIFTAPARGKYWFSSSISVYDQVFATVYIMKNSNETVLAYPDRRGYGNNNWETATASTVMDLQFGDTVYCRWNSGTTTTSYSVKGTHSTSFSGTLLIQY